MNTANYLAMEVCRRDAGGMMCHHAKGNVLELVDLLWKGSSSFAGQNVCIDTYLHCILLVCEKYLYGGVGIIRIFWQLLCSPNICWDTCDSVI